MVYQKQTWIDLPSKTTPLSAERLSHMETQYDEAVAYTSSILDKRVSVNPRDFGAVGDGLTDDTAAFQAACDAIGPDGGEVSVDSGNYNLKGFVRVKARTRLSGNGATILKKNSLGASSSVVFAVLAGTDDSIQDVTISGFTVQGERGVNSANLVWAHRASGLTVRDVLGLDCIRDGHLIDLQGCRDVLVEGVTVSGALSTSNRGYVEAVQVDHSVRNGSPEPGVTSEVYDGTACKNVTVRGCQFLKSSSGDPAPRGFGMHSTVEGKMHQNIRFEDNVQETPQVSAAWQSVLNINSIEGLTVSGNSFEIEPGFPFPAVVWYHKMSTWVPLADVDVAGVVTVPATSDMVGSRISVNNNLFPESYDKAVNCYFRPTFKNGFRDFNTTSELRIYASEAGVEMIGALSCPDASGISGSTGLVAFTLPAWACPKRNATYFSYGSAGATFAAEVRTNGDVLIQRYSNSSQANPFLPVSKYFQVW